MIPNSHGYGMEYQSIDNKNLSSHLRNWAAREFGEENAVIKLQHPYLRIERMHISS